MNSKTFKFDSTLNIRCAAKNAPLPPLFNFINNNEIKIIILYYNKKNIPKFSIQKIKVINTFQMI